MEGKLLVIEPELVEDRGVEVVDVDTVFGDGDAMLVGRAMDDAAFNAASSQPR